MLFEPTDPVKSSLCAEAGVLDYLTQLSQLIGVAVSARQAT
jgi:hypothetical protein